MKGINIRMFIPKVASRPKWKSLHFFALAKLILMIYGSVFRSLGIARDEKSV